MRVLLSKMGWVKGCSDLEYNYDGKTYFIELKTPKGKQSKEQKDFQSTLEKQGFEYHLIRDLDSFINLIDKINKFQKKTL